MIRSATFLSLVLLFSAAGQGWAAPLQSRPEQAGLAVTSSPVTLPAGAKVELAVTAPVWAKTAKPGDPLYTQTNFPVAAGDSIAIPAGTFVEGRIEAITLPTRKTSRAELKIAFTKIIFANGYTIVLPDSSLASPASAVDAAAQNASPAATVALVTAQMSTANDLLLDNGAQIEMTLAAPLSLNAAQVANAVPLSRAPEPGKFKSATLCRPTAGDPGSPGTPGSPDTVIPGSPGTPSITIPGGPGMPDTVIPGTPATPDTVIPGSPGTPGIPGTPGTICPAAPMVISSVPVTTNPVQSQSSIPVTK